jgi:hypothetical protein
MALHYGVKAANYPLTEEDLEKMELPARLRPYRSRLYGLTIDAQRLAQVRENRRPNSRYATIDQCRWELAQADKLFNLLADSQVSMRDEMRAREDDPGSRDDVRDAARQQRDAAIENLLGPAKAAEFQSFEKSIPARMQVNRIGESMEAANVPLSDAQRTSLIAAVMVERDASPPPERSQASGAEEPDYQARFLDWQADLSSRVQARVEPLLTAAQVTQYREAIEVQNARRAQARVAVPAGVAVGGTGQ